MAIRTSRTKWTGGIDGKGTVALETSGAGTFDVSFPKRIADAAEGTTSPEELIGAAHSSCFAMQFSALLGEAGATPGSLDVAAAVRLGPVEGGGFEIKEIKLTVSGKASGIDADKFREVAEKAKETCPVSVALKAVPISLDVTFEEA